MTTQDAGPATIRLRYAAVCSKCEAPLSAGTHAHWDRAAKAATCQSCLGPPVQAPRATAPSSPPPTPLSPPTRLRHRVTCTECRVAIPAGVEVRWDAVAERAEHIDCANPGEAVDVPTARFDRGTAGGSARAKGDRKAAERAEEKRRTDEAILAKFPRIGKVVLTALDVLGEDEELSSWEKGALGEERIGTMLDGLRAEGFVVLHDRVRPPSKANIDHVVVGPRGVYVIDAKRYSGVLSFKEGRKGTRVYLDDRPRDALVKKMSWQVELVQEACGDVVARMGGTIQPVLCFTGCQVARSEQPRVIDGVIVTWSTRLVKDLSRKGSLDLRSIAVLAERLAKKLPPAPT